MGFLEYIPVIIT